MSFQSAFCICDSFGAQNIACLAPFHHTNSEDEFEVVDYDVGSEHDIVAVISIPSDKTKHADQTESLLHCVPSDQQLLDACLEDKNSTTKTRLPIGVGNVARTLYSSSPTPQEPLGRGYLPDSYREHIEPSDEDKHTECSRSLSRGHTSSVDGRDCERTSTVGDRLRHIDLATGEHSSVTESREGSVVSIGKRDNSRTRDIQRSRHSSSSSSMESISSAESARETCPESPKRSTSNNKRAYMDHPAFGEKTAYWGYFRTEAYTPQFTKTSRGKPKLASANGSTARAPEFIIADHTRDDMPHFHVLFLVNSKSSHVRTLTRIREYLGLTASEFTHLKTSLQMVHDIESVILYLNKYGVSLLYSSCKFWTDQLDIISQMPTDTLIDCLNIIQSRRAMNKPDYHNRRTELTTWIKDMIRERTRPPYTWRKLIHTLTEDEHTTLQVEFGCSHKSYVNELMQILNNTVRQQQPPRMADQLAAFHGDKSGNVAAHKWLRELFEANNLDPRLFWIDLQRVADKEPLKTNGFAIIGPPNCFKSQILRLLFEPLHVTPMTRTGNGNHFWLQSVLYQPLCLYEEPLITPQDVQDWKLLLEGAPFKVAVKNQPDDILERTPFFITSNHDIWKYVNGTDANALRERVVIYRFHTQINSDFQRGRFSAAPCTLSSLDVFSFFNTLKCPSVNSPGLHKRLGLGKSS